MTLSADHHIPDSMPEDTWSALSDDPNSRLVDCRTSYEWKAIGLPDLSQIDKETVCVEWKQAPAMSVNPRFAEELDAALGGAYPDTLYSLHLHQCGGGLRGEAAVTVTKRVAGQGIADETGRPSVRAAYLEKTGAMRAAARQKLWGNMTEDCWASVRTELAASLGNDAFKNWIEPLEYQGVDSGVAVFGAPTTFIGNWVQRNYGSRIHELMARNGASIERIDFRIGKPHPPQPARPLAETSVDRSATSSGGSAPVARPKGGEMHHATLDPRYTFERFVVGKPNELAHAAARRVAESTVVSFNPLFLYGGVGLGKTHLMHAIAWEIMSKRPDAKVMYLSAEAFMNRFVQALKNKDMMTFKEMFRSVDVLMVDDVQFISGKDSTQDEFFYTFNALIDQQKQIVISADRAPGEIDGIEDRIKSRLQWGLVVDVHPTDYELRLGIIEAKAESMAGHYPEVTVAKGVYEFLAQRISSNVRVLEGALTRLFAFGSLAGKEMTVEMTQECLSDILRQSERKVTIDEIIRKVAAHYNIRINDILSQRRARAVARPRQVAMYLAKTPEIGRKFGGRDHTTVIHAVRKITELKTMDAGIEEDIELLRRSLEA